MPLFGPYPTIEEVMQKKLTHKFVTRASPNLHTAVLAKSKSTGITISEILRRALRLWIAGKLDNLVTDAPPGRDPP